VCLDSRLLDLPRYGPEPAHNRSSEAAPC
jgi:hypothetical protein